MKAIYDVCAPAKLNLFLHITGRRADGYHTLQSAFMLIDWCDTLHFERRFDGVISREDTGTLLPDDDLTVCAARALRAAAAVRPGANAQGLGVHIGLEKRIPTQAGMGGGSSDAASTLLALNRLWQLNLPAQQLLDIGLGLGADVPFFLRGQNAWVEGIGEQITPITLPLARFVVLKPQAGVATAQIFKHPDLVRDSAPAIIMGFAANPFQFGRNDLQAVAQGLCPSIGEGLDWLQARGLQGRMTGSGSAVFAQFEGDRLDESDRLEISPEMGHVESHIDGRAVDGRFEVKVCRNLQRHPLSGWLDPVG